MSLMIRYHFCWALFVISTVIAAGVYTGWMQFVAMNELCMEHRENSPNYFTFQIV